MRVHGLHRNASPVSDRAAATRHIPVIVVSIVDEVPGATYFVVVTARK